MDAKWVIRSLEGCRGRAGRRLRVKCRVDGGVEYCIYNYKGADWRIFYENPCLAYARGTVVVDGRELVMPFTKFFNLGEAPATRLSGLEEGFRGAYVKLDGSLVVAWRDPVTGDLRAHSRGMLWMEGLRGVRVDGPVRNPFAAGLLRAARKMGVYGVLRRLVDEYAVVMFELVVPGAPASRIHTKGSMADYGAEAYRMGRPYLLAARERRGLRLVPPGELDWPLKPRVLEGGMREVLALVQSRGDVEGAVAWYESLPYEGDLRYLDPLVKVKSRQYLVRVSGIASKRGLIAYALSGGLDDVRWQLDDREVEALEEARAEFERLLELARALSPRWREVKSLGVKGWLLDAVRSPDRALAALTEQAPSDLEELPGFIRSAARRLERVAARLGVKD